MANDQYWNYVVLAMHMDGDNNGTTFVDQKSNALTIVGNTCTKTAIKQLGTASAYFDGSGDYITVTPTTALQIGAVDFTVEAFARFVSSASVYMIYAANNYTSASGLKISAYAGNIYVGHNSVSFNTTGLGLATGTFYHIALTRSGTTYRLFVNGVLVYSTTGTPSAVTYDRVTIGAFIANGSSASAWYGYIDDLRITKGVARYTADFSTPTEPFPNQAPQLSGVVLDSSGAPASRIIRAHRSSDGLLGGSTTSSSGDGTFSVSAYDASTHYVVCFDDDASENALIFDNLTPIV